MVQSIFVRVQQVLSASAENIADAAERVSGTSLMREAVRQVERAEDEARASRDAARARAAHAERQQQLVRERLATLDEQARFALSKERPDLAEAAIARQLDFEAQAKDIDAARQSALKEEAKLEQCLAALKLRKAEMKKELDAFEAARREASFPGSPPPAAERAGRKAEQAETLFERAMAAAGGVSPGLADTESAAKLAEVEAMRREAAVADRLAALRAAAAAPTGAKRRKAG
jgi:phage shock protein A